MCSTGPLTRSDASFDADALVRPSANATDERKLSKLGRWSRDFGIKEVSASLLFREVRHFWVTEGDKIAVLVVAGERGSRFDVAEEGGGGFVVEEFAVDEGAQI